MRVAIPTWAGRVSPVFDVARELFVVDVDHDLELRRETCALDCVGITQRVEAMVARGIEVLICGAISRPLRDMVTASGVRVVPHICGGVEDVLNSFKTGRLETDLPLHMPGCGMPIPTGNRRNHRWRRQSMGRRPPAGANPTTFNE